MLDFSHMLQALYNTPVSDFSQWDYDSDGTITTEDLPPGISPGSPAAKTWWRQVMEPSTQNQITEDMKTKYGDQVVGAYEGRPLVPDLLGEGQGDYLFLTKKLQIVNGFGEEAAQRIAGKVMYNLYGRV